MNAQQLKNSILQMAVQGKLVPQDPNDEPASVLLERIRKEKEKLIKEGKIKKEKNPSYIFRGEDNLPYEKVGKNEPVCIADEVPFEIPETWEWVRFKNVVCYSMGKTPPRKESEYWDNPCYPWVSIADMVDGTVISSTKEQVNQYASENTFKGRISSAGTLLMSFKLTVGKVSILGIDAYHNEAIISIFPFVNECNATRDYLFKTLPLLSQLGDTKTAIKGNTLNSDSLDALLIPLPPIPEQLRIVTILKELAEPLSYYDKLEQTSTKLDEEFPELLKKSILQQAVMGKLVPQDPNDEPASLLLEKIRTEKDALINAGKLKKDKHESVIYRRDNSHYEKLDGIERCIDDEIPFDIPATWIWARFGSLMINHDSERIPLSVDERRNLTKKYDYYGASGVIDKVDRFLFDKPLLLIGEDGANLLNRSTPIAFIASGYYWVNNHAHVLDVPEGLLLKYMEIYINAISLAPYVTGTAQPKMNQEKMNSILVPVPPTAEQNRIISAMDNVYSIIVQL